MLAFPLGICIFAGEEISLSRSSSSNREADFDSGPSVSNAESPAGVLQEIGMKCGTKVTIGVYIMKIWHSTYV